MPHTKTYYSVYDIWSIPEPLTDKSIYRCAGGGGLGLVFWWEKDEKNALSCYINSFFSRDALKFALSLEFLHIIQVKAFYKQEGCNPRSKILYNIPLVTFLEDNPECIDGEFQAQSDSQ